jgi:hypothetical protein
MPGFNLRGAPGLQQGGGAADIPRVWSRWYPEFPARDLCWTSRAFLKRTGQLWRFGILRHGLNHSSCIAALTKTRAAASKSSTLPPPKKRNLQPSPRTRRQPDLRSSRIPTGARFAQVCLERLRAVPPRSGSCFVCLGSSSGVSSRCAHAFELDSRCS